MIESYENQCYLLSVQLRLWKLANEDQDLIFQWNYPREVGLIAPMVDALNNNFVSVNDAARKMLAELGWDTRSTNAPTVMQVRAVIDRVYGSADETKPSEASEHRR